MSVDWKNQLIRGNELCVCLCNFFLKLSSGKNQMTCQQVHSELKWSILFGNVFSGDILLRNMIFAYHWHQEIQQNSKRSKKCLRTQRQNNSQMSNIGFLMDWAQMSDLDFVLWRNYICNKTAICKWKRDAKFLWEITQKITLNLSFIPFKWYFWPYTMWIYAKSLLEQVYLFFSDFYYWS